MESGVLTNGLKSLFLFFEFHEAATLSNNVNEALQFVRCGFERVEHQTHTFAVGPLEDLLFSVFIINDIFFGNLKQ